jgi:hypothetical protein
VPSDFPAMLGADPEQLCGVNELHRLGLSVPINTSSITKAAGIKLE